MAENCGRRIPGGRWFRAGRVAKALKGLCRPSFDLRFVFAVGLALIANAFAPTVASADGEFFQLDASEQSATGVFALERGRLQYALRRSMWDGGYHWNGRVAWKFPLQLGDIPVTFRLGPTGQYNHGGTWDDGISAVAESYNATSWGGFFALTDLSTIDNSYFVLLQFAHRSGVTLELSGAGNRDDYEEKAVTLAYRIGRGPFSLRLGRKFEAKETYIGFSINTF